MGKNTDGCCKCTNDRGCMDCCWWFWMSWINDWVGCVIAFWVVAIVLIRLGEVRWVDVDEKMSGFDTINVLDCWALEVETIVYWTQFDREKILYFLWYLDYEHIIVKEFDTNQYITISNLNRFVFVSKAKRERVVNLSTKCVCFTDLVMIRKKKIFSFFCLHIRKWKIL